MRVSAAAQLGAHSLVALVDPRGVAVDARGPVGRGHRVDGGRALGATKIAVEQCVVVDGALRVLREDRRRDSTQPLKRGTGGAPRVLRP